MSKANYREQGSGPPWQQSGGSDSSSNSWVHDKARRIRKHAGEGVEVEVLRGQPETVLVKFPHEPWPPTHLATTDEMNKFLYLLQQ